MIRKITLVLLALLVLTPTIEAEAKGPVNVSVKVRQRNPVRHRVYTTYEPRPVHGAVGTLDIPIIGEFLQLGGALTVRPGGRAGTEHHVIGQGRSRRR